MTTIRYDHQIILSWVQDQSTVLDLGCGDGSLMSLLIKNKQATGYGLDISSSQIAECIERGVNVIQSDLDQGLSHFDDNSFDVVILSLTLQAMHKPKLILQEMLRVGRLGIVTFPNFAYWRNRWQLGFKGLMPLGETLPHKWYDTPNIHLCTMQDFASLCEKLGFAITRSDSISKNGKLGVIKDAWPNVFGEIVICEFKKKA